MVDVNGILSEMIDNVINTKPFKVNSGFLGELEIGSGKIKMNLPLVNRALVLSHQDLIELKDMLNEQIERSGRNVTPFLFVYNNLYKICLFIK